MGGAIKSVAKSAVGLVGTALGADAGTQQAAAPAAPVAASTTAQPSYAPPPELRGTAQDAQNTLDFQNSASRRRSISGAQTLASAGTTGSNAGTKTLLGS